MEKVTSDNNIIDEVLARLYRCQDPPWAVAFSGFLAKSYYVEYPVPHEIREKFDVLNARLIYWWPQMQLPLGTIYWNEYAGCIEIVATQDTADKQLVIIERAILRLALIQLRVLSILEVRHGERRPGIGNDVYEITERSFERCVNEYIALASSDRTTHLKYWMQILTTERAPDWEIGLDEIFAPLGGPPSEPKP